MLVRTGRRMERSEIFIRGGICVELRTANCELRAASCELRTANCELRTANCELRTANCELRTANCELRGTNLQTGTGLERVPALAARSSQFAVCWSRHS